MIEKKIEEYLVEWGTFKSKIYDIQRLLETSYGYVVTMERLIERLDHPKKEYLYSYYSKLVDDFKVIAKVLRDIKKG